MSPEWAIVDRTHKIVSDLAAARQFVSAPGENIRSVVPAAVRKMRIPEGGPGIRSSSGMVNTPMPGIFVVGLPVETFLGLGVNCADDEAHRVSVIIVDSVGRHASPGAIRTYLDWMDKIREELLAIPNPFLQDAEPDDYDPFVVHVIRRLPAESQSLLQFEQQVAMLNFQVMVRHHR
jgi:hypothetical protein